MTRTSSPLPARRAVVTSKVYWENRDWLVGAGFDHEGHVREIFVDGVKTGTTLEATADDICIIASKLMQSGYRAHEVLDMLCQPPEATSNYSGSLISVLLQKAIEEEDAERRRRAGA